MYVVRKAMWIRGGACAPELPLIGVWNCLGWLRFCLSFVLTYFEYIFCVFTMCWCICRGLRLYVFGAFLILVCCGGSISLSILCVWVVPSSIFVGYVSVDSRLCGLVGGGLPLLSRCEIWRCILGLFMLFYPLLGLVSSIPPAL